MSWTVLFLVGAMVLIVVRLYSKLRAARKSRLASWDQHLVERLRSRGYVPFREYPVDFFIALPDEAACQAVRARLEPEFSVDVKAMQDDPEMHFSLHATRSMRLIVQDMQEQSARMTALASENRGRYDGWAA
jgi:hypothetical protein